MLDPQSKTLSAFFSFSLFGLSIACYALLVLLFVTPTTYHLESLIHPNRGILQPTVAVGLVTAILMGATSAFITRCVEQSLWLRLSATTPGTNALTVQESHHLAQWSVSPLERLVIYPFKGSSWLLKFSGIVLFGTAAVNPVLLSGISQERQLTSTTDQQPNSVPMVSSRLDVGNSAYRGGQARDNPTLIASLAEMSNLTPSILDVCNSSACRIEALTTAINADCTWSTSANSDGIALISGGRTDPYSICSTAMPTNCVTLRGGAPNTYANFSSTYHPACFQDTCAPGAWSSLFGAWVSGTDTTSNSAHDLHTVECLLTFGNITITQKGTNPPTLDTATFVLSPWSIRNAELGNFVQMNRIYTESGSENSPYSFSGRAVGTGDNTLYREPLGYALLGTDANFGAERVARQIERNFGRSTLSAYARQANASVLVVTTDVEDNIYVYQSRVLLVLLLPVVATLVGGWARWRVGGEDLVVGYSPVEIARRGPVEGLPGAEDTEGAEGRRFGRWVVWGVRQGLSRQDRSGGVAVRYAAGEELPPEGGSGTGREKDGTAEQREQPTR